MEEQSYLNEGRYYSKLIYNDFNNFSLHGLNIEGLKKYYLTPDNFKYIHQNQVNEDLKKRFEEHAKLEEEKKKIYEIKIKNKDINNIMKKYIVKKEENVNKIPISLVKKHIFEERHNMDINKSITDDKGKDKEKENMNHNLFQHFSTQSNNIKREKVNRSVNKNTISISGFNKFKRGRKIKGKSIDLPKINPRKIIIEHYLINDAGVPKDKKNIGYNNYMGEKYNFFNYYPEPKNRCKRNVFGSIFLH